MKYSLPIYVALGGFTGVALEGLIMNNTRASAKTSQETARAANESAWGARQSAYIATHQAIKDGAVANATDANWDGSDKPKPGQTPASAGNSA